MSIDDTYIVKQLKADTVNGFALLVKRYTEPIYWHIRRMVVSHDDAQDAMQETFIRINRSVGSYDEIRSLSAWIYKIATREALRIIGQRKQHEVSADDRMALLDERTADCYIDYHDAEAIRLQRAILTLPDKQQLAFNLRYYDNMSFAEIADVTDSTPASAKTNYHIAKEKIIRYMNNHD